MSLSLEGKVALVTGAGRGGHGIGYGIAVALAAAGADVVITARTNIADAEAVAVLPLPPKAATLIAPELASAPESSPRRLMPFAYPLPA